MSQTPTSHDLRLNPQPLLELAYRDFWRHPKAGNGQEGAMRLFFLNHFPALAYLLAMLLLVVGTYLILGIREATDRQYEAELANPFNWWVSVSKDPTAKLPVEGGGSLLPERFWRDDAPYYRYTLHLLPKGSSMPRDARGRSFQPDDPVLENAARNLVWPQDPETFRAAVGRDGFYGLVITRFLYERILEYDSVPEFPTVRTWVQRRQDVPIPVLGIVEYLPDGEFLISEAFAETFVSGTWRTRLFPRQAWLWQEGEEDYEAGEAAVELAEERFSEALSDLEVPFESLEVTGYEGHPALFVQFPDQGVDRARFLEALVKSDLIGGKWSFDTMDEEIKAGDRIRYDRVAYVVEQDLDLVTEMVEYCREQDLEVDASILLRAGALVRGREHFLKQSNMVLWLNWGAALGLLVTVMMFKTHRGIHNAGVYLALGGRASDGYLMAALQFLMIFAALLIAVTLTSLGLAAAGLRQAEGFHAFLPWDATYFVPLLGMATLAFAAIIFVRMYLHRRLWPASMILYRE